MSDQAKSPSPEKKDDSLPRSRSPSPRGTMDAAHADHSPRNEADQSPRRSRSPSPDATHDRDQDRDRDSGAPNADDPDAVNPGNNVYVANLPHRLTQPELDEIFSKFGRLEKCEVIVDPLTRESRGFAFVTFEDVRDADDAVKELNGKEVQGRRLRVEIAKRRRGHEKTPGKYLGPRLASTKYGRDGRDSRDRRERSRSHSYGRRRSRSRDRSRDRYSRGRYDDRDRYERRYDDRESHHHSYDRYDDRRARR